MKAHPPPANPPKASSISSKSKGKKGGKGFLALTNYPHKNGQPWGKDRNKKGVYGKDGKKGDKGGDKGKGGKPRWTPYPPPLAIADGTVAPEPAPTQAQQPGK